MAASFLRRILARLEYAEAHESNPHLQDDYRIAWITVLYAARGEPQPQVAATYAVLGLHPDKVWPAIVARRKAMLGADYDKFFAEHPPKKPVKSVTVREERQRRKA
jgi:hypothetical protein